MCIYLHFSEEYKANIFYYLMDVLSTVSQFVTRTSYIGTNIVMMVIFFTVIDSHL